MASYCRGRQIGGAYEGLEVNIMALSSHALWTRDEYQKQKRGSESEVLNVNPHHEVYYLAVKG